jgi:hypothetical protein
MIVLLFAAVILVVAVLAVLFAGLPFARDEPQRAPDPAVTAVRTLIVGDDLEPGTYTTQGGSRCTWTRVRGFSGRRGDVIQSGTSPGPVTVTVQASDRGFVTSGCAEWVGPT